MKTKRQNIGHFFIFLAGFIILAHMVVPHNHHLELFHFAQETSDSNNLNCHHQEKADSHFHCHAFNLLAQRKEYQIIKTVFSIQPDCSLSFIFESVDLLPEEEHFISISSEQPRIAQKIYRSVQSHRAPPFSLLLILLG